MEDGIGVLHHDTTLCRLGVLYPFSTKCEFYNTFLQLCNGARMKALTFAVVFILDKFPHSYCPSLLCCHTCYFRLVATRTFHETKPINYYAFSN